MRVWLINSSEVVPTDPGNVRLQRMGLLAEVLVERGHGLLWWTSTFLHSLKQHRCRESTRVKVRDRYHVQMLHAPAYLRNISLARIRNHRVLGREFARGCREEPRPDVVLCSFPTLELSAEAVRYGQEQGVPVALDIRDMWPDIFLDHVPRWAGPLARLALHPMFAQARRACAGATAITGHAPAFVQWGLATGRRRRTPLDRHFPHAYGPFVPDETTAALAEEFWHEHQLSNDPETAIVCFIGQIGHQFDLATVIEAARRLRGRRRVQFVLCGVGMRLEDCRRLAADCGHDVLLPGWVDAPQIWWLLRRADLGLAPYVPRADFEASLPNKAIEYLCGGLPILTSLRRGTLLDLLTEHDCGLSYGGDPGKLAETIESLADDPARRQRMAENALRLFEERFTAQKVYNDMATWLEQIAAAQDESGHEPATDPVQDDRRATPQPASNHTA